MTKLPDFTSIFEGTKAPQPEALRLADRLDPLTRKDLDNLTCSVAAIELRRLHKVNEELNKVNAELLATPRFASAGS